MQILSDVLNPTELQQAQKVLMSQHWGFGFVSTDSNSPIWNFDKEYCKPLLFNLMQNEHLQKFVLQDAHINGQTCLMDGSIHRDTAGGCTHAFVYFPYPWDPMWGGKLHLHMPDGEIKSVTPKVNTGVLFDASLPHYAEGTTVKGRNRLRVSVGLKMVAK